MLGLPDPDRVSEPLYTAYLLEIWYFDLGQAFNEINVLGLPDPDRVSEPGARTRTQALPALGTDWKGNHRS